jgi:hypothetical protein
MHRRVLAAAFAATLVLPGVTEAQFQPLETDVRWSPGFRVNPFVGYLTAFTRAEEWVFQEGQEMAYVQSDVRIGGGPALGLHVETPLSGRFGLTAAGAYGSRSDTDFSVRQTGDVYRIDGAHVLMGRLGLALHLAEDVDELVVRRMNASLFAGGVVMHERPRDRLGSGAAQANGTHFGVNFGVSGEVPFANDRMAVQFGVEDNMMFWRQAPLSALAYAYFGQPGTTPASTIAKGETTHAFLLRAGLRLRL